jgi:porphobilinogen synthase
MMALFPHARPRRLRRSETLRRMVRDITLTTSDLIAPLFVKHGENIRTPIPSMPGVSQLSVDQAVHDAQAMAALGIPAVILFGLPASKDAAGTEGYAPDGIIQRAVKAIKSSIPELLVITDVCLCEYTDHGHCGIVDADGYLLNDETLDLLRRIAKSHAQAGADIVAPSGMVDGMVAAIRDALDGDDFGHIPIMSYSVKYASSFYGPFRDASGGAPQFGDRRSHQMDPANARDALREAALDVAEGADFLMVKPALAYLDIIRQLSDSYPKLPMVAYNVSGEYSMIKAAAAAGYLDERAAVLELLHAIKRSGADLIITYHAKDAAQWLQ